ncbi:hypothetical protein GMSM_28620 [Geomonas sp. Red276]
MTFRVGDKGVLVRGRFPRIVYLEDELFDWVNAPYRFLGELKEEGVEGDLFTFVQQGVDERSPKFDFYHEWESLAVLPITSFDAWWTRQIRTHERNRIRKAEKSGIEVRPIEFDDETVKAIKLIYDESPVRQGKPFWHYQKSLETLKKENGTFLERSQFLGAFYRGEMIGFVKLVHDEGVSSLMQIISMIGHRDKAPTNALLAKTIELCASKGIPYLRYSTWSRRGLGDFKRNHAFQQIEVPRYFVPLNLRGRLALRLKLHRPIAELLPEKLVDAAVLARNRLNARILRRKQGLPPGAAFDEERTD